MRINQLQLSSAAAAVSFLPLPRPILININAECLFSSRRMFIYTGRGGDGGRSQHPRRYRERGPLEIAFFMRFAYFMRIKWIIK